MKVAFTGHRDYFLADKHRLESVIEMLYNDGFRTFMSGMAEGFDLAAAEAVLRLKCRLTDIRLECIIPFDGHSSVMNKSNTDRYNAICKQADRVVSLATKYHPKAYFERNDFLIDNADAVICYYSGKRRSGTGYTVMRGFKKGLRTINLYADGVQIEFFG